MKNTIKTIINNIVCDKKFHKYYTLENVTLNNNNLYCSLAYKTKYKDDQLATQIKQALTTSIQTHYPDTIIYISFVLYNKENNRKDIGNIKHIIAVASGKGGVGKSTISINLAYCLQHLGYKVGILDADLYGPSIDFMLQGKISSGDNPNYPLRPYVKNTIKYNSIANFLKNKNSAILLRSPMLIKTFKQMLLETDWGNLDYLLLDLPPGTGDLHLYLLHSFPHTNVIIVCTSQKVALLDARKSISMYKQKQTKILGIIENMSSFICPDCQSLHSIFDGGKIQELAQEQNINYLGDLPIDISLRTACDNQMNLIDNQPHQPISRILLDISKKILSYCN